MSNTDRLDIVIFGVTGYTGKFTALKLVNLNKHIKNIKWGIGGRSKNKMEYILQDIGKISGENLRNIQHIVADVEDEESLINMTSHARVIINCVGPFILYGENVVKACIATGTQYIDATFETCFMEKIHFEYHKEAEENGIYVINACCVQSVPADMGAIFLMKHFKGEINLIKSYFEVLYENSGWLASHINGWSKGHIANYATCDSLMWSAVYERNTKTVQYKGYRQQPQIVFPIFKDRPLIFHSSIINGWCVPTFVSDEAVLSHTQRYLAEQNNHKPAHVKGYQTFRSWVGAVVFLMVIAFFYVVSLTKFTTTLLKKYPRLFTFGYFSDEGPAVETERKTKFTVTLCAEGWKEKDECLAQQNAKPLNKKMIVKVSGMSCYEASWTSLALCAVTLLKEREKMPGRGGVLTPGAAFANTSLIEELEKHGLKFRIVSQEEI